MDQWGQAFEGDMGRGSTVFSLSLFFLAMSCLNLLYHMLPAQCAASEQVPSLSVMSFMYWNFSKTMRLNEAFTFVRSSQMFGTVIETDWEHLWRQLFRFQTLYFSGPSLSQHGILQVHWFCPKWWDFLLFEGQIKFLFKFYYWRVFIIVKTWNQCGYLTMH